ncbi:hypothetical protein ACFRDV_22110 [Streptomyces fagopyri]|uniref:hypothetical protein n=1 Tax=Streptomyces fagopyri TaxID=2662397 RepID=UPI0036B8A1A5
MTDVESVEAWLREALGAAQQRAEEAALETGSAEWEYHAHGSLDGAGPAGGMVAVGSQDYLAPAPGQFMAANDPAAVLRGIAADRALLDDLLSEKHFVLEEDCWYTCGAATEERDGGDTCDTGRLGKPCDCGRDARVARRVQLLAQRYGWTATTPMNPV